MANNDPAACYPCGVLGLGATVETNRRKIPADAFFRGLLETALEEGELITRVHLPIAERAIYLKFPNPASRFSIVGVFVRKDDAGVRVAVTGAGPCVFRVRQMEDALAERFQPGSVSAIRVPSEQLISDVHGSPAFRSYLITELVKKAVALLNRPGG